MTLHIVRGNPTPEEIAAVTVVLTAVAAAEKPAPKPGRWADPAHRLRTPLQPGPDAWVRSALPR
jgi:hypothetical protein